MILGLIEVLSCEISANLVNYVKLLIFSTDASYLLFSKFTTLILFNSFQTLDSMFPDTVLLFLLFKLLFCLYRLLGQPRISELCLACGVCSVVSSLLSAVCAPQFARNPHTDSPLNATASHGQFNSHAAKQPRPVGLPSQNQIMFLFRGISRA